MPARSARATTHSGISGDISPACRETPVRDVLSQDTVNQNTVNQNTVNQNTVSPTLSARHCPRYEFQARRSRISEPESA